MPCEHKRVWEMKSVSTQGYYKHEPDSNMLIKEDTFTTGALWWKKEHKFSDLCDMSMPTYVYDPTELNKFLADGWEPMQVEGWKVTLKRLRACEECKKNSTKQVSMTCPHDVSRFAFCERCSHILPVSGESYPLSY